MCQFQKFCKKLHFFSEQAESKLALIQVKRNAHNSQSIHLCTPLGRRVWAANVSFRNKAYLPRYHFSPSLQQKWLFRTLANKQSKQNRKINLKVKACKNTWFCFWTILKTDETLKNIENVSNFRKEKLSLVSLSTTNKVNPFWTRVNVQAVFWTIMKKCIENKFHCLWSGVMLIF
jgi:hypothetical protein